jgi:hypothetical protein
VAAHPVKATSRQTFSGAALVQADLHQAFRGATLVQANPHQAFDGAAHHAGPPLRRAAPPTAGLTPVMGLGPSWGLVSAVISGLVGP